jgi:hypothetical protein
MARQPTAYRMGPAIISAAATKHACSTTKRSRMPKPMFGFRSAELRRRDTTPPTAAKARPCTHVNISTISPDAGSVSGEPSPAPWRKSAVPSTVGV